MSILKYFQTVKKSSRDQLPDPNGPLNTEGKVPSSAINSANIAVQAVLVESPKKSEATTDCSLGLKSRGPYLHLTPAQKINIGKRASELTWSDTCATLHIPISYCRVTKHDKRVPCMASS